MSDSDERPDLMEVVEDSADLLNAAREAGIRPLTGEAQVQLVVTTFNVATPQEAVEVAVRNLLMRGADNFTFAVTDRETGDHYLVRGGELMSLKDARNELGDYDRPEEGGDDPGEDAADE